LQQLKDRMTAADFARVVRRQCSPTLIRHGTPGFLRRNEVMPSNGGGQAVTKKFCYDFFCEVLI